MSSAAATETFGVTIDHTQAESEAVVDAITHADVDTAAESVARYVGEDVRYLVHGAHVDLRRELSVPDDMGEDNAVIVELLMADIERMLRKSLIREVHLILSDQDVNANNQVSARYHAHYEVRGATARRGTGAWNGIVQAPPRALAGAHFALLISWRGDVKLEKKKQIRPPEYFFTWMPSSRNYDTTGLVRYRFGGLDAGPIQVTRIESAQLNFLR